MIASGIGDEGARAMSEMLKVNTTLTILALDSEEEREKKKRKKNEERVNNRESDWSCRSEDVKGCMGWSRWKTRLIKHTMVNHTIRQFS